MHIQVSFVLAGTTRFNSPTAWNADPNGQAMIDMKNVYRTAGSTYADLNIYTTTLQDDLLGCAPVTLRLALPVFDVALSI